jgi:hypothetical protein
MNPQKLLGFWTMASVRNSKYVLVKRNVSETGTVSVLRLRDGVYVIHHRQNPSDFNCRTGETVIMKFDTGEFVEI